MTLGEKISNLRKGQNLTQKELAERLNVTTGTIAEWESDEAALNIIDIKKLCSTFSIRADIFLMDDESNDVITLEEKEDHSTSEKQNTNSQKPFYRKIWFWIVIGVVFVSSIVAIILLLNRDTKPLYDKDGNPVFVEMTNEVYTNAKKYLGYHVNVKGKVFQVMSDNGTVKGIQIWIDPDTCEQNMMIYYNTNAEVKQGDYVMCSGYIDSVTKYKNAYDAALYAPVVCSEDLRKSTYIEVMAPATETMTLKNVKQEKFGYSVSIDKIEFSDKETRVYATATNNGKTLFWVDANSAVIVQDGKQYNAESNYEANYEEIPYNVVKGVSSSGIILFPPISSNEFELTIGVHSDDYDEKLENFKFKISKDEKNSSVIDETPPSTPTKPSNTSTTTQTSMLKNRNKEAVSEAEKWAQVFFPTDRYFIRNLLIQPSLEQGFDAFSDTEADYAIENANVDWKEHALKKFNDFLSNNPEYIEFYTPANFNLDLQFLTDDGFTNTEISYVRQNHKIDWNANALAVIRKKISEYPPETTHYTPKGLKETTLFDFSDTQKEYAIKNCGIDWNAEAVETVEVYDLNLPNWSSEYNGRLVKKDEMYKELINTGFTEAQAKYGVDNCNIN